LAHTYSSRVQHGHKTGTMHPENPAHIPSRSSILVQPGPPYRPAPSDPVSPASLCPPHRTSQVLYETDWHWQVDYGTGWPMAKAFKVCEKPADAYSETQQCKRGADIADLQVGVFHYDTCACVGTITTTTFKAALVAATRPHDELLCKVRRAVGTSEPKCLPKRAELGRCPLA
jgi:hypothetical protein